jgi:hypothetical protein
MIVAEMLCRRRVRQKVVESGLPNGFYSTSFSLNENPLSEGGVWQNGRQAGTDWANMRSLGGKVWGLQNVDVPGQGSFHDGTAILKGTFSADQYAEAAVYVDSLTGTAFPETELRLRSAISANINRGYEIAYSCKSDGTGYLIVVRWNGPFGSFDYIVNDHSAEHFVVTGDVMRAEIAGNTITVYKNGSLITTADITSIGGTVWTDGNPGIGHNSEDTDGSSNSHYGLTSFEAGNI